MARPQRWNTRVLALASTAFANGEANAHTSDKTHHLLRCMLHTSAASRPTRSRARSNSASSRRRRSRTAKQTPTLPTRPTPCFASSPPPARVRRRCPRARAPTPRLHVDDVRERRSKRPHFRQDPPLASRPAHRRHAFDADALARALQLRVFTSTTFANGEANAHTSDKTHRLLRVQPTAGTRSTPMPSRARSNSASSRRRRSRTAKQTPTLPTRPTTCFASSPPPARVRRRCPRARAPTPRLHVDDVRERRSKRPHFRQDPPLASRPAHRLLRVQPTAGTRSRPTRSRARSNSAASRRRRSRTAKQTPTLPTRPTPCFASSPPRARVRGRRGRARAPTPRLRVDAVRERRSKRPHFRQDPPLASLQAAYERGFEADAVSRALQLRVFASTPFANGEANAHTSDKTHPLLRVQPTAGTRSRPTRSRARSNSASSRRRRS
jgi:hypothetical protein